MSINQILSIVDKEKKKFYFDNKSKLSKQEYKQKLQASKTIYIGNLAFYTTEQQIYSAFQRCGPIKDLHIGLNKYRKLPCGFCLLQYFKKEDALRAINVLHLSKLDGRQIKVEKDVGYSEGRQFGRGYEGGQKRDERKNTRDQGRPQITSFHSLTRKHYNDRRNQYQQQHHHSHHHRGGNYRGGGRGRYNQRRSNHHHDNRYYHSYKKFNNYDQDNQDQNQRGSKRGKMYADDQKQFNEDQQHQQRNRSTSRENQKMYSSWQ